MDQDYRGCISVLLINNSDTTVDVGIGDDRIIQFICEHIVYSNVEEVLTVSSTARGCKKVLDPQVSNNHIFLYICLSCMGFYFVALHKNHVIHFTFLIEQIINLHNILILSGSLRTRCG